MFSEELVQFIAKSSMPAYVTVSRLASEEGHQLQSEAKEINKISGSDYTIEIQLQREATQLRLDSLLQNKHSQRPVPYILPDLSDVAVDKNGLVDISEFDSSNGGLAIGNSVFEILPSTNAHNSSYWTLCCLNSLPSNIRPRIRLDPLMHSSRKGYSAMFYKMFVFGQPLNWQKILDLKQESMHRWMPDFPDRADMVFTDVVWTPRDNEIHLRCEECPKPEFSNCRSSRYFHSILDRKSEKIIHCDGAIRIFNEVESLDRTKSHVNSAGKLGTRIKVFQIDEELDTALWVQLFKAFFVWNIDIENFADKLSNS